MIDQNTVRVDANNTLSEIAEHHHTTVAQLVKDNHISNQNLIHVGDKLVVTPGAKVSTASQSTSASQMVSNNNQAQPIQNTNNGTISDTITNNSSSDTITNNSSAANAIAQAESGGSYTAQNGRLA